MGGDDDGGAPERWDGVDRRRPWFRFQWTISFGTVLTLLGGVCVAVSLIFAVGRGVEQVIESITTEATIRQSQADATQKSIDGLREQINDRLGYVERQEKADVANMVERFRDLQAIVGESIHRRGGDNGGDRPSAPGDGHG